VTVELRVASLEGRVSHLESDRDSQGDKLDHLLKVVVDLHNDMRRLDERLPDIIARAVVDAQRDLRKEMNERFEQVNERFEQVNANIQQVAASVIGLREELPALIGQAMALPRSESGSNA
jgi:uncharacterized coiled-coil protein SlyX